MLQVLFATCYVGRDLMKLRKASFREKESLHTDKQLVISSLITK